LESDNYQEIEHLQPLSRFNEVNDLLGNIWHKNQANKKNLDWKQSNLQAAAQKAAQSRAG